jgi:hypothetical protein
MGVAAEVYYVIGILLTLQSFFFGVVWKLHREQKEDSKAVMKSIELQAEIARTAREALKSMSDARYNELIRKDAEILAQLANERLDRVMQFGHHMTKAEFEKRFERLENQQFITDEKVDEVLRRMPKRFTDE